MDKFPMTVIGKTKLEEELSHLKTVERKSIIAAISEARAHGDLSENAEYSAAKEKQSFIEGRIQEIEAKLSVAEVVDPKSLSGDVVRFSATVIIIDEDSGDEISYQIVGEDEANLEHGKLFFRSPLARGLIGKAKGDIVEIMTPSGSKSYEILDVQYI